MKTNHPQKMVAQLVKTPGFSNLPEWVQTTLIRSRNVPKGRVGDIWRFVQAAKAWKFSPYLPKGIAQKVGGMNVTSRLVSYLAWDGGKLYEGGSNRAERVKAFWTKFREMHDEMSLIDLLMESKERALRDHHCRWVLSTLVEIHFGLQKGSARDSLNQWWFGERRNASALLDILERFGGSVIFGTGKRLRQLLAKASHDQKLWAAFLARGNADLVQKVLGMDCIPFVDELLPFLRHLPKKVAIRLIGQTTFKYRGKVSEVSQELLENCGFLWNKLIEGSIPKLGRLRDWFGIHEDLAKIYVERLPDGPLTVHPIAAQLNGVSAIDGRWELVAPKSVGELKWYGKTLQNCLGSYGDRINSGRSVVLVVLEVGQPTHCIEVRGREITQFSGPRNSDPDPRVYEEVCGILFLSGLVG